MSESFPSRILFVNKLCLHEIFPDNILHDQEKLTATPFARLLSWRIAPEAIGQLKSSQTPFVTAFDYFEDKKKFQQIKFNVESLDLLTEGGIDVGSVTEIFGEAGSGKTQLCLELALNCASLKELHGRTIYISTDKHFPIRRLHQMATCMEQRLNLSGLLDCIDIMEFSSKEDFELFVNVKLPQRLELYPNIRLVVVDSIAGIFRYETNYIKRAEEMRSAIQKLESLADKHNYAIIMTNHITSIPTDFGAAKSVSCLGTAFENLVETKLRITRTEEFKLSKDREVSRVRILDVIFSPRLPRRKGRFLISSSGISEAFE